MSENEKLKAHIAKLENLDNAKSEFFTHITHELRTPLTVIKGVTQYLKQSSGQKHAKAINELERSTEDLLDMVGQILDLRKLSSSKLKLDLKQTDLLLHLNYIVDRLQFPALQKGITLAIETNTSAIIMDLDITKLRSVINNIITNALKYTPEGGKITLNVSLLQKGSTAKIEITDTGEGISHTDLQKAFQLFYQAEDKLFTKHKGSGVGLYYVKQLIDLMNGDIDIDSKEGKGTRVTVKLPITHNSEVLQENFDTVDLPQGKELAEDHPKIHNLYKILIIEDNSSVRTLLQQQLKDYKLFFAKNGDKGLKKAFKIIPDLIISDIMMPGKNGYELCKVLKKDPRLKYIPIILLTARVDRASKIKGLEVEADAYLKKPFDYTELKVQIKNLIKNSLQFKNINQGFDKNTIYTRQPQEDEFILKFKKVVLDHIDKEEFRIKDICDILKISRSGLHSKIKSLTGLSTSNYINNLRLQKAKSLIETENTNISGISYKVGITNLPYFSTLFKKEYGMSPREYKESLVYK